MAAGGMTSAALPTLAGCTLLGPALVICHCCVYNFALSARRHVALTSQ